MEFSAEHISQISKEDQDFQVNPLKLAIKTFKQYDFATPTAGDFFFEGFGPGNVIAGMNKPMEKFIHYEQLLLALQKADPVKYQLIFKGTPFYFMAWLCLQMKNFDKAVFYMDAAVSEDISKIIFNHKQLHNTEERPDDQLVIILMDSWIRQESGRYFSLSGGIHTMKEIIDYLRNFWQLQLDRFNLDTNSTLSLADFINDFVLSLVSTREGRSIVTALYSFVLEYEDIINLILLRSSKGGSLEPIVMNLFKGGLIVESLLKHKYCANSSNLGAILRRTDLKAKYGISQLNTSAGGLSSIILGIGGNSNPETAFKTTAKIRDTTGHKLGWDDIFDTPAKYATLFEQMINAILYICKVDFCMGRAPNVC